LYNNNVYVYVQLGYSETTEKLIKTFLMSFLVVSAPICSYGRALA